MKVTFEVWERKLNDLCEQRLGLGILDLPDTDTWVAWDAGQSPEEFYQMVIQAMVDEVF